MINIYSSTARYQQLMHYIQESDDLENLTEEDWHELNCLGDDIESSLIELSYIIKEVEAHTNAINEAILEMKNRRDKSLKKLNKLKEFVQETMEKCEIKKINSPYFDISIYKNPSRVEIRDERTIPEKYLIHETFIKIDKNKIKEDIKNQIEVTGAYLVNYNRLEIK